jgi:bifunctional DNase/RNase
MWNNINRHLLMTQKKHKEEKEIVSMKILGLIFDPNLNTTVVVLLDAEQERVLPIWIGPMEGNAIAIGMEKVNTPRPMTHDLMKNLLDQFQVEVLIRAPVTPLPWPSG